MTAPATYSGRSTPLAGLKTPLREFLHTESGSAAVLLAATVAALVWVAVDVSSYDAFWDAELSVRAAGHGIAMSAREWVNSGLMALFFFVVGLEARRELDMGDLRERRRIVLPVLAGLGGMLVPVLVFLALNAGSSGARGWGVAMSTDTAFALGLLALVDRRLPERVRAFLLTAVVVDDVVALVVIAVVYSDEVRTGPLLVALALLLAVLLLRRLQPRPGLLAALLAVATWGAALESGIDPVVTGLVLGLLVLAYPPERSALDEATGLVRSFREQPTPELARSASQGLVAALSPNERLQGLYHPWTSRVIVPVFALANAGISVDPDFLTRAYGTPLTLGIVLGYVLGKPAGIVGASWLVSRLSRGRLVPPVGWAAVAGTGAIAGIGFTVSLLIATLAFRGQQLQEAKLGVLTAALVSSVVSWVVFRVTRRLAPLPRSRALLGTSETLVDLAVPVDDERDHVRGPADAPVTLVEYGDFQCPYCGQAEPVVRELLREVGDVRYAWRHLPLTDVHPQAQLAAEAAEAAHRQGAFWPMHDRLMDAQEDLRPAALLRHAEELGLDVDRFRDDLRSHAYQGRVAADVESADLSGVSGTPTFFVNGQRHYGAYDILSLKAAVKTARAQVAVRAAGTPSTRSD